MSKEWYDSHAAYNHYNTHNVKFQKYENDYVKYSLKLLINPPMRNT